jgi:hypothetical protein
MANGAFAHPGHAVQGDVVSIAKVRIGADRAELLRLKNEGYDVAGVNLGNGTADVITHNQDESAALAFNGYKLLSAKRVDTKVTPDSGYKTPDQIDKVVHQLQTQYPNLVHVESIGKSLEGRDVWAVKISTNPGGHEPAKPAVLFNGMHHAREVMSPEVVLDTANWLLANYGKDASATKWVDGAEIWLIPMVNPDGNNMVWTSDSMWRKNTRGGYGVDINRNYPYAWASCNGSSNSENADDYHGTAAASEPETQLMTAFVSRIQPVFDISYHSYSELVIYPYGCNGSRSETQDIVEPLGKKMASLIPSESGSGTYTPGTAWETLYDVDGDDIDWMYNAEHVIAFVIELTSDASGFQPPYDTRDRLVQSVRPAWQLLLDRLAQSGVRGMVTDATDGPLPNATVTVVAKGAGGEPISWTVKHDGSYHLVLNPGTYTLKFQNGTKSAEKTVTIGADLVRQDVKL